jgi:ABC-type transport system involved in multi-copper enzyme maturation permease subunit
MVDMEKPKAHSIVFIIAKYAFADEVRQKSMIVLFILSTLSVFLLRQCYKGDYMVNGQTLSADAIAVTLSKIAFHVIAAGAMFIAALLTMRVYKRDRDEGMLSCILSKPIDRWQYVTGKVLGLWVLSVLFMFILHSIVFFISSLSMKTLLPAFLTAFLICSLNLLFVILTVLLLSLMLPDIAAFLCTVGIGIVSLTLNGIYSFNQSQMGQAMMQQSLDHGQTGFSWWKTTYYLWPNLFGTQYFATSLIGNEGSVAAYPLINVLLYSLILGVALFWRFRNEDVV